MEWLDPLMRVIHACMEQSQTLVALLVFHGVITELNRLLSLRSTMLTIRMLDLVILVILQIVQSLPHGKANLAESLLSQHMNLTVMNQIATLLVRCG